MRTCGGDPRKNTVQLQKEYKGVPANILTGSGILN